MYLYVIGNLPAWFAPHIMLIQSISGPALFETVITVIGASCNLHRPLPFPLLLFGAKTVVVTSVPMWIHLHVLLPLNSSLLVVLGLFFPTKPVPLQF